MIHQNMMLSRFNEFLKIPLFRYKNKYTTHELSLPKANLPVQMRHHSFWDVSPSFLQNSNDLERWIPISAWMDDDWTAKLGLGMCCCFKNSVFTVRQRPRAANFPYYTTLDIASISSIENFINNNFCQLKKTNVILVSVLFGGYNLWWEETKRTFQPFPPVKWILCFPNKKATIQNPLQFKIKMSFLLCHQRKDVMKIARNNCSYLLK